jgi:hypothetical protein
VADAPVTPLGADERFSVRLRRYEANLRRRFGLAYILLAVVVGVAVAMFVVILGAQDTKEREWSQFRPVAPGLQGAQQIADHVAPQYRLKKGGDQLATVLAGPATVQDVPITAVAVRSGYPDEAPGNVPVYPSRDAVMFQICGSGESCSLGGTPSAERAMLLRREVLELSLFSFKYLDAKSVIAFTPPFYSEDGSKLTQTVSFLRKDDFERELGVPLATVLPERTRHAPNLLSAGEKQVARKVRILQYEFQPLPDGSALLVAAPF